MYIERLGGKRTARDVAITSIARATKKNQVHPKNYPHIDVVTD